jgi:hypothetical protein
MSFKLFIYYSAVCSAWAAFLGWGLGRWLAATEYTYLDAQIKGVALGTLVALALALVDALGNRAGRKLGDLARPVALAAGVGFVGGLIGALVGVFLVRTLAKSGHWLVTPFCIILGWTVTGLAVGASVGVYDILARLQRKESPSGALRKVKNGLLGGTLGGLVGSLLYVVVQAVFARDVPLRIPSAVGFVALGLFIGLLIGLAQVILKEAWIKVEAGFRPGRELMLTKPEITIGRAESCDIGLFGDGSIDRVHARILLQDNCYLLADAGSSGGTWLNDQPVREPMPLRSGDAIRLGNSLLRFGERQKQAVRP